MLVIKCLNTAAISYQSRQLSAIGFRKKGLRPGIAFYIFGCRCDVIIKCFIIYLATNNGYADSLKPIATPYINKLYKLLMT